jgi:formylmethanofuran dehydrogenase subunit E
MQDRQRFDRLLAESVALHGHLCAGQVIGVRMSLLGLHLLGIADPKGADRRKLYVVVEIDRCATDAIQSVTGCSLGKRSLRWVDLGIMAATFADLEQARAVRITAREESRAQAQQYRPDIVDKYQRQLAAYQEMPDDRFCFGFST